MTKRERLQRLVDGAMKTWRKKSGPRPIRGRYYSGGNSMMTEEACCVVTAAAMAVGESRRDIIAIEKAVREKYGLEYSDLHDIMDFFDESVGRRPTNLAQKTGMKMGRALFGPDDEPLPRGKLMRIKVKV